MRTKRTALWTAALLGVLSLFAFTAPASAGPGNHWSGCYGGGAVGYAISTTPTTLNTIIGSVGVDGLGAEGANVTGIVGCDLQLSRIVLGAWGSYTWDSSDLTTHITLNSAPIGVNGDLANFGIDKHWAAGFRAGYLVTKDVLAYGLLGYTQAESTGLNAPLFNTSFAVPDFKGIVVGGGAEIDLTQGWFLRGEYRYSRYDSEQINVIPGIASLNFEPRLQEAEIGLTYKFDFWDAR